MVPCAAAGAVARSAAARPPSPIRLLRIALLPPMTSIFRNPSGDCACGRIRADWARAHRRLAAWGNGGRDDGIRFRREAPCLDNIAGREPLPEACEHRAEQHAPGLRLAARPQPP